jgi:hypothetical protein
MRPRIKFVWMANPWSYMLGLFLTGHAGGSFYNEGPTPYSYAVALLAVILLFVGNTKKVV